MEQIVGDKKLKQRILKIQRHDIPLHFLAPYDLGVAVFACDVRNYRIVRVLSERLAAVGRICKALGEFFALRKKV